MYRVKQNGKHGVWICDENMPSPEDEHKNNLDDDLVRLSKVLEERHSSDGAMILGLDTFIQTYRFALRFLKRYEKGAEKVLFSLTFDESEENPSEITAHFMEFLQKQLRKSDVIIQIKSDQILVFLPIITKEEGDMVIERIEKAFQEADFATTHIKHVADHISFE